jgi:hypothetical protein
MLPQAQIDNLIDTFLDGPINGGAGSLTHLFQNDVTPSALTVLGDLVEADFAGYAAAGPQTDWYQTVDAETGYHGVRNNDEAVYHATTGVGTPQTIYGWYVTSDGGALASAIRLPAPIIVAGIQDIAVERLIPFLTKVTPI